MLTRLRLKQAFGRLVRREGDRGVFVMLDRQLPSRLCGTFPQGVLVRRVGLAEAVAATPRAARVVSGASMAYCSSGFGDGETIALFVRFSIQARPQTIKSASHSERRPIVSQGVV